MTFEVCRCPDDFHAWHVEMVDDDNELGHDHGAVYVTCFSGPMAKERAVEFAMLKALPRASYSCRVN